MARAIIEGIHEVELQVTPEFKKPAGADMWAGVPDKTRKLVDQMVQKGHLSSIGLVPSVATPVLVRAAKLKDSEGEKFVIGRLEVWTDVAINHARTWMGSYDPIMVLWPFAGSTWTEFWGDVIDVVTKVNKLTGHYGEAGQRNEVPSDTVEEGGPFTVTVNSPEATDVLAGTFGSAAAAKEAGENWKAEVAGMHGDPDRAEGMYSWVVFDADYDEVAKG